MAQTVKRLSMMRETRVQSLGWEGPWRRKWQSTPVLLPGKSHGQRTLVGRKESDMTERLHVHVHQSQHIQYLLKWFSFPVYKTLQGNLLYKFVVEQYPLWAPRKTHLSQIAEQNEQVYFNLLLSFWINFRHVTNLMAPIPWRAEVNPLFSPL